MCSDKKAGARKAANSARVGRERMLWVTIRGLFYVREIPTL